MIRLIEIGLFDSNLTCKHKHDATRKTEKKIFERK